MKEIFSGEVYEILPTTNGIIFSYCNEILDENVVVAYKMISFDNGRFTNIAKNIYLNHDVTMHVAPGIEIRVFAKDMNKIETYLEIENDPDCLKSMLDCWSKYNQPSSDYIYTTIDLEEWKELKKLPPIEL